jgi:uncharacterized protein YecE (DUF72 family)
MGEIYPPNTPQSQFLRVYSHTFPAVEGNSTFYAIPEQKILTRWCEQTPPEFRFCLKFPRAITHNGSLEPYIPQAAVFVQQMQHLGERLGIMFVQLPPQYAPDRWTDLVAFLTQLPRPEVKIALEVRHLDWFVSPHRERLNELLTTLGIGRVVLDSRPIYAADPDVVMNFECKKPRVPIEFSLTAPFSLIRYVSHPLKSANQIWLEEWAVQIQEWLRLAPQIYLFVHCPIEARSPINARYLHHIFTRSGVALPPLPSPPSTDTPVQLSLF